MRKINEIILHCTDTEAGKDYTVAQIRQWHLDRGFNDIGYHYVIHPNGRISLGRPISKPGAHCKGHNANSIGIAYIGGRHDGKPKDTRTPEQVAAMDRLILALVEMYPIEHVKGHSDYSKKACPCFNVQEYLNRFCTTCPFHGQDCVYCKTCKLNLV